MNRVQFLQDIIEKLAEANPDQSKLVAVSALTDVVGDVLSEIFSGDMVFGILAMPKNTPASGNIGVKTIHTASDDQLLFMLKESLSGLEKDKAKNTTIIN